MRSPLSVPGRGPSAPLVVALLLVIGVLGMFLWVGLTDDPAHSARKTVLLLPLPEKPMVVDELPTLENVAPEATVPPSAPPSTTPSQSGTTPPVVPAAPAAPDRTESVRPPALPATPAPALPRPAATLAGPTSPDALPSAPDPALVERGPDGLLPIIARDGRKPWAVYARPFDTTNPRPRIAIIVSGLGQSAAATEAAIQTLPPTVTLAFSPYGQRLDYWAARARGAGHETLVLVPMEPVNYPANDPGPQTLLTSLSPEENRERLNWSMARFPGYVGVLTLAGSYYSTALESLRPTLEEINKRGLIFVDSRSSLRSSAFRIAGEVGVPRAINNRFIDTQTSKEEIDRRLDELVKIAMTSGFAVGIGQPYPITIERIIAFVRGADARGLAIAPVSAIADLQKE